MNWELVGYIAKRRMTREGWVSPWPSHPDAGFPCAAPVDEICSVSNCIARRLGGLDDPACDGPLGLYAEARTAWAVVPAKARSDFALYAYRLWPVCFADGTGEEFELWWEPSVEPMSESFVRLGWDPVEGGNGQSFGCSPLSCNVGADIVRCPELNRYCLVGEEQAAMALARSFSITKPEPGPYCVVEVWRDTATAVCPGTAPERAAT